ncbi:MAG: class I tRNA ligase family protein, partial [Candidatus Pacebacteria bacterium]|nr:class I tRNA ligase family protein [Candidatus Paceibacterota bacterium]
MALLRQGYGRASAFHMKSYDHKKIENKWQRQWEKDGANSTDTDLSKPKYYVLDMFPYPSGAGLHVGHPKGYIGSDVVARKKRMEGYRVLHPMGWDAFGLPAENYAIKTGKPPQQTTDESIATFKSQISNLGLSYDWDREIGSHRPDYYRWTQWLFTKFFEKGLVYKKKALVNWDPVDQTVLANEQVLPDGTAERSGAVVEKKDLEQWFYKITDYADELADSLDTIDWPESTKINQRNWIGRSEGAEIDFFLDFGDETINAGTDENGKRAHITVFTTRPDTLYGATYLVLAPEHLWVTLALGHKTVLRNNDEVATYVEKSKKKADIDRMAADKEKTGVELKGVSAVNPATGERIPMYIADYVLAQYGTGAIMAVPAHDQRDYDFARTYDLPIRQVVMPVFGTENKRPDAVFRNTVNAVVRNDDGRLLFLKWKDYNWFSNVIGGVEEGESIEDAAVREVLEETGYRARPIYVAPLAVESHYYADHKKEWRSRLDTPVLLELESDQKGPLSEEERAKHDTAWMTYEEAQKHGLFHNNQLALDLATGRIGAYTDVLHGEHQALVNSGDYNGMSVEEAKRVMTEKYGRVKKTYRIRDWLISRQRY